MAPPRYVAVWDALIAAQADFSESGPDEVGSGRYQKAGPANFAHGRCDEMTQTKVDINAVIGQL